MKSRIESEVRCDVVHPVLEISQKEIEFSYIWTQNEEPCLQKKEINMKNISLLALNFYLKTEVPFNLSCYEFSLLPGQSAEVTLDFDPLYLGNKVSHVLEGFITVVYRSHPYREKIKVTADIMFPNLSFESQDIAFGCFLNETSKRVLVNLKNTSTIPASYYWVFEEPSLPLGMFLLTHFFKLVTLYVIEFLPLIFLIIITILRYVVCVLLLVINILSSIIISLSDLLLCWIDSLYPFRHALNVLSNYFFNEQTDGHTYGNREESCEKPFIFIYPLCPHTCPSIRHPTRKARTVLYCTVRSTYSNFPTAKPFDTSY